MNRRQYGKTKTREFGVRLGPFPGPGPGVSRTLSSLGALRLQNKIPYGLPALQGEPGLSSKPLCLGHTKHAGMGQHTSAE